MTNSDNGMIVSEIYRSFFEQLKEDCSFNWYSVINGFYYHLNMYH